MTNVHDDDSDCPRGSVIGRPAGARQALREALWGAVPRRVPRLRDRLRPGELRHQRARLPHTLAGNSTVLLVGAFLMLLNTVVDIGKGVLFFPIAERRGKRTALVYLAAITVQVVLLDLGVLFLLMLVPLSEFVAGATASPAGLGSLLTQANTLAFELGQGTLAFGALFMTWFLFQNRMVPRTLAVWGVAAYAIHLAGAIAEIFGIHVGLLMSLPGGLFEVAFGIWLIAKGFDSVTEVGRRLVDRSQPAATTAMAG